MNKETHVRFVCRRFFSGFLMILIWVLLSVTVIFTVHGTTFRPSYSNADMHECAASCLTPSVVDGTICRGEVGIVASVRHETVKRGAHESEMEPGEYVVASSFKSPDNARHFASGLRNLEFNARYGYLTEKELWFVYIIKTSDPKKARAEHARVSAMFLLRDAWLITVEP